MGYMYIVGPCYGCRRIFAYHPDHVPSIPIGPDGKPAHGGDRRPICQSCITVVNERRKAEGRPPWPIHPDAYEPAESV